MGHIIGKLITAGEQSQKVLEIASLLKAQEDERQKIMKNNESAMEMYEKQHKELRRANRDVQCLQDRLSLLEKNQEELKTEVSWHKT